MIIYLHGFASTGASSKVDMLRDKFGTERVLSPDLPFDPKEVHSLIQSKISAYFYNGSLQKAQKLIFVGTSLGAFYANYFGHLYDSPAVLVNPSPDPGLSLYSKLGTNVNYITKEEFMVSIAHLDKLSLMRKYVRENYAGPLVNLFVAKDDDVIPYEYVLESFPYYNSLTVTEDGGHRFTKHWDKVVQRVDEISKM